MDQFKSKNSCLFDASLGQCAIHSSPQCSKDAWPKIPQDYSDTPADPQDLSCTATGQATLSHIVAPKYSSHGWVHGCDAFLSEFGLSRAILPQKTQELQTCEIMGHFHSMRMDNSCTAPLHPLLKHQSADKRTTQMKGILESGVLHSDSDGEEALLAGLAERCSQCSCTNVGPCWPIYKLASNHAHLHICTFYFFV